MSQSSDWDLQVAIMDFINAMGTLPKVYNPVPSAVDRPYGRLDVPFSSPVRRLSGAMRASIVYLDWFGNDVETAAGVTYVRGDSQVRAWAAIAHEALDGARLALPDHTVVRLRWTQDRNLPDQADNLRRVQQEFRVIVE